MYDAYVGRYAIGTTHRYVHREGTVFMAQPRRRQVEVFPEVGNVFLKPSSDATVIRQGDKGKITTSSPP